MSSYFNLGSYELITTPNLHGAQHFMDFLKKTNHT